MVESKETGGFWGHGKHVQDYSYVLDRGIDPISIAAEFATGKTKCGECRGRGKITVSHRHRSETIQTCPCCHGSGYQNISPEVRLLAINAILTHVEPETLVAPAKEALGKLLESGDNETVILTAKAIIAGAAGKPIVAR